MTTSATGHATGADTTASRPAPANRSWLLAVLLAGQFIANVDTAIANVAAPAIRAGFDAAEGQVALVVSGYTVAYAVLLVTGARLGSTHGHRRIFLLGLLGFTAASLACGLAPGVGSLVAARFAQGAAAALMVPQVLSGIQTHFTGQDRTRALAHYALALSGGAVAGQVLGGVLISANLFGSGWRSVFLINVPLGVALLVAARRLLPADPARTRGQNDLAGVATLSTAVLLLVLPLTLGQGQGWPAWTWLCLAASGPAFAWFALVERRVAARGGRPLVAPALLRVGAVRHGLLAHGLTTSTYFALLFVLALYLQQGMGVSPAHSGLALVVWVTAFGVAGQLLPRVPARHRPVLPMVGCVVLAVGYASVLVWLLAGGRTGLGLFALLGIGGFGLGISANSLIRTITSAPPTGHAADLSGVINTNAQLSGALGVAVAGTGYLALQGLPRLGPAGALGVVLAAFAVLALVSAGAARRATRGVTEP
ncbi:MFS transporter [Goodfellowiella coeruleoviolacea]|nr:MFS transporter [Goodfellowiella coeruleoviolacea]